MNHLMSVATLFLFLTMQFVTASAPTFTFGDRVNLWSSTNYNETSMNEQDGWVRASRNGHEVGAAYSDDVVMTRNTEDSVSTGFNVAGSVARVARFVLKLYGKQNTQANILRITARNNEATLHAVPANASGSHQQHLASRVVQHPNGSNNWISFFNNTSGSLLILDFLELDSLPAPVLKYVDSVGGVVAPEFSGTVGIVEDTNQSVFTDPMLKGSQAATFSLKGNTGNHFSLNGEKLVFTAPEASDTSYTITVEANHLGEVDTIDVTIMVQEESMTLVSSENSAIVETLVEVYDLQGRKIKSLSLLERWQENLEQGVYVIRRIPTGGTPVQKIEVLP